MRSLRSPQTVQYIRRSSPSSRTIIEVEHTVRRVSLSEVQECTGAEGGNRTRTVSPQPDFESGASTNSATPARGRGL